MVFKDSPFIWHWWIKRKRKFAGRWSKDIQTPPCVISLLDPSLLLSQSQITALSNFSLQSAHSLVHLTNSIISVGFLPTHLLLDERPTLSFFPPHNEGKTTTETDGITQRWRWDWGENVTASSVSPRGWHIISYPTQIITAPGELSVWSKKKSRERNL